MRTVHVEISDRTHVGMGEIQDGLKRLAILSEDSYDFEDILENAISSLYRMLPGGEINYGGEKPKIGTIFLSRTNASVMVHRPGHTVIQWIPSPFYKERIGGYCHLTLAMINLREKVYSPNFHDNDENHSRIPDTLTNDTHEVMKALGLKKIESFSWYNR